MIKIEHNVETGEIKEIELTAKEIKERAIIEAATQAKQADAEAKATVKAALLERLGINPDEAALLLS